MTASRMFPFITCTWNPLCGRCHHECDYCWARDLAKSRNLTKYFSDLPQMDIRQVGKHFKKGDYVFVQDMTDLFGKWVQSWQIRNVLSTIRESPEARFLLLTKNPERYFEFLYPDTLIPENCVLGCTIESDQINPQLGRAPTRFNRLFYMTHLRKLINERKLAGKPPHNLFVSIEPILDFNFDEFTNVLCNWIIPEGLAVGYDNYGHNLPEPSLQKTMKLIDKVEFDHGICVHRKTLREAWNA